MFRSGAGSDGHRKIGSAVFIAGVTVTVPKLHRRAERDLVGVKLAVQVVLFDVREDQCPPPPTRVDMSPVLVAALLDGRRVVPVHRRVVVHSDDLLLEVVGALHAGGGFADLLHGGEQQPDQDRDDRDHDQQLDQRERRGRDAGRFSGEMRMRPDGTKHSRLILRAEGAEMPNRVRGAGRARDEG